MTGADRALTAVVATMIAGSAALAQAAAWPAWADFSQWSDIDEAYRKEFARCDADNVFKGHRLNRRIGKSYYYGCSSDPSRVTMLKRLSPTHALPRGAIAYTSKLAVDLDGSWYACNTPGRTDQCPTSLSLRGAGGRMEPVSSDSVLYIAIPVRGPSDQLSKEFRQKTGVGQGDFGVVVTATEAVPVIVADGGPFSKLGEGSIALHRRLGRELCAAKDALGRCTQIARPLTSIGGPLVTIIVPGSRRSDVTHSNIAAVTASEGEKIWTQVRSTLAR